MLGFLKKPLSPQCITLLELLAEPAKWRLADHYTKAVMRGEVWVNVSGSRNGGRYLHVRCGSRDIGDTFSWRETRLIVRAFETVSNHLVKAAADESMANSLLVLREAKSG